MDKILFGKMDKTRKKHYRSTFSDIKGVKDCCRKFEENESLARGKMKKLKEMESAFLARFGGMTEEEYHPDDERELT